MTKRANFFEHCAALFLAATVFSASWGLSTLVFGVGLFRILGLATLLALVHNAFMRGRVFKITAPEFMLAALWSWCLLTYFWSKDTSLSGTQIFDASLTAFLIFMATSRLGRNELHWKIIGLFYILGCAVAAVIVLTNGTVTGMTGGQNEDRASVGEINANYIAYAIATAVPMALTLLSQKDNRLFIKAIAGIYIPVAFSAILLGGSRGALIAAAAALLLYAALFLRKQFFRSLALLILAYVCLYFFYDYLPDSAQDRFDAFTSVFYSSNSGQGVDLTGREYVWPLAQQLFFENLVKGIGFGAFPAMNGEGISVHNVFLTMAAETGIPGLLLFSATIATIFYRVIFQSFTPDIRKGGVMLLVTWLPIAMTGVWEASSVAWMAFGWYYAASKHAYTHAENQVARPRRALPSRC